MPRTTGVVIQKLKLRAAAGHAGAAEVGAFRERALRALRGAELHPPELSPSAVLLVRRLEALAPGFEAQLGRSRPGPAGLPGPGAGLHFAGWDRWELEVRRSLSEYAAVASRPVRGDLPDDAAAVLFRDPAEMTAALLVDVARGKAQARWWWRGAAVDAAALRDLSLAFVREPLLVPAAVSYLIAWGRAEEVALALTPRQARGLARRLCSAYGLTRLASLLDELAGDDLRDAGGELGTGGVARAGAGGEGGRRRAVGRPGWGGRSEEAGVLDGFGGTDQCGQSPGVWGEVRPFPAPRKANDPAAFARYAGAGDRDPGTAVGAGGSGRKGAAGRTARLVTAPWSKAAPDFAAAGPSVGKERAALLGLAAALARSPHGARTTAFAARFETWWRHSALLEKRGVVPGDALGRSPGNFAGVAGSGGLRDGSAPAPGGGSPGGEGDRAGGVSPGRGTGMPVWPGSAEGAGGAPPGSVISHSGIGAGRSGAGEPAAGTSEAESRSPGEPGSPDRTRGARGTVPTDRRGTSPGPGRGERRRGTAGPEAAAGVAGEGALRAAGDVAAPAAKSAPDAPWSSAPWCETGLGGLLYLLNLMKRLGLPGCFEAGWRLESVLGSWGCVQAIAIGLLALRAAPARAPSDSGGQEVWSDPIWRLLAQLEGRELDEPLGKGLIDPGTFAVPPAWFRLIGPGVAVGGGLSPVAGGDSAPGVAERPSHVPRTAPAAGEEAGRAPGTELATSLEASGCPFQLSPALRRWITLAAPYVAAYMKAASRPVGGDGLDPASLLFVRGRIYSSATHIDLVAGLDQVSLAARVAGLDADPGWDPGAGRVVLFHFL